MTDWMFDAFLVGLTLLVISIVVGAKRAFVKSAHRFGERLGLWGLCLFITFFGPLASSEPKWPPYAWVSALNDSHEFKDLWLSYIGMLLYSFSNIADNLMRSIKDLRRIVQFLVPLVLLTYSIFIMIGLLKYNYFAKTTVPEPWFTFYICMLCTGIVFGPVVEMVIVLEKSD